MLARVGIKAHGDNGYRAARGDQPGSTVTRAALPSPAAPPSAPAATRRGPRCAPLLAGGRLAAVPRPARPSQAAVDTPPGARPALIGARCPPAARPTRPIGRPRGDAQGPPAGAPPPPLSSRPPARARGIAGTRPSPPGQAPRGRIRTRLGRDPVRHPRHAPHAPVDGGCSRPRGPLGAARRLSGCPSPARRRSGQPDRPPPGPAQPMSPTARPAVSRPAPRHRPAPIRSGTPGPHPATPAQFPPAHCARGPSAAHAQLDSSKWGERQAECPTCRNRGPRTFTGNQIEPSPKRVALHAHPPISFLM